MELTGKDILALGFPEGPVIGEVMRVYLTLRGQGAPLLNFTDEMRAILADPARFVDHSVFSGIAAKLLPPPKTEYSFKTPDEATTVTAIWGQENIDQNTLDQMSIATRLPVSVAGALMPDAHLGYGLPIGGVLAVRNAVIPYAVGVDIACRMRMSVLPIPVEGKRNTIDRRMDELKRAVEDNTRFGVGAKFEGREQKSHPVLDMDWDVTKITGHVRPLAEEQLGTSGSGNHFCDIGEIEFTEPFVRNGETLVEPGKYIAVLTHSGSRGPGAQVADFYSKLARTLHPDLPPEFKYLAWLDLDTDAGREYWTAMQLMGLFAAANHELIHRGIAKTLKEKPLLEVENHHNFAWEEMPGGKFGTEKLIIHRKGATPAGPGVLGIIPGSMATPAYLVEGTSSPIDAKVASLWSVSHGAGRAMSRNKTKELYRWAHVRGMLKERRVELMSAGLDENPFAYKNIDKVMTAQAELIRICAKFVPRIVKMAPEGEPSED